VLLCGSTHVAIDNILERMDEPLRERFNILPVRIGRSDRISCDIKQFQLEELSKTIGIDSSLLLDAANLVCGTTIGISSNPQFKRSKIEPAVPEFDYLIIDESSKTTFQEFLVPALYAKNGYLQAM